MSNYHKSVLLKEVINYLKIEPGQKYIDATLGGGGHAFEIASKGGIVLGIDADQDAIDYVSERIKHEKSGISSITLIKSNFRYIDEIASNNNFNQVSGIIFDLGVSGHQLDTAERGFSFAFDGKLDMRMDQSLQVTAADLLKVLTKGELYELFTKFGEERYAYRIAKNIVESRRVKPIETTSELLGLVRMSTGRIEINSTAARIFQALRIAVNDELFSIEEALVKSLNVLSKNGRIIVISFHSLEDRIVKQVFREWSNRKIGSVLTNKPVLPDKEEIIANTRSRSAKMRVFEKTKVD